MTRPVARTAQVRRTVRVAVALVAGQAALCAVIGWVTFGPSPGDDRPAASHRVDVLAGPPITVPPGLPAVPTRADPAPAPARTRPAAGPSVGSGSSVGTGSSAGSASSAGTKSSAGTAPAASAPVTSPPATTAPAFSEPPPVPLIVDGRPWPPPTTTVPATPAPPSPDDGSWSTRRHSRPPDPAPAEVGERCADEDAEATTGDGTAVRCRPDREDELRWQII